MVGAVRCGVQRSGMLGGGSGVSSRLPGPPDAGSATEEELDQGCVVSDDDVEDAGERDPLLRLIGAAEQHHPRENSVVGTVPSTSPLRTIPARFVGISIIVFANIIVVSTVRSPTADETSPRNQE